jgi:hypothetical protein
MHKTFHGHSHLGVAILGLGLVLGLLLRFYNLGDQSPWSDELASWYYKDHLQEVFYRESHSPLYYLLLRIFLPAGADIYALRLFSAVVSTLHLGAFFWLGRRLLGPSAGGLFFLLMCLNPADIAYARMARHYAWLLEGTVLFYLLLRLHARTWVISLCAVFLSFLHIFALIPIWVMLGVDYIKFKHAGRALALWGASSLVLLYYLLRMLMLGSARVAENLLWNTSDFFSFWQNILTQFLGNHYPRSGFYPIALEPAATLVLGGVIFLLWRQRASGRLFLLVLLTSLVAVEFINAFWINLRVERYLIYLCGLFSLALADSIKHPRDWHLAGALAVSLGILAFIFNPWPSYPWDDEAVVSWQDFRSQHQAEQVLICATRYQAAYYGFGDAQLCEGFPLAYDPQRPLLFFDLNYDQKRLHAVLIMQNMQVVDFRRQPHSLLVFFKPRVTDQ